MVHYTKHHMTVYWPAEADLEDALVRWNLTEQDLYNMWPTGTYAEIFDDLETMQPHDHTTNIGRDAGIFAEFLGGNA